MKHLVLIAGTLIAAVLYGGCGNPTANPITPVTSGGWSRMDSVHTSAPVNTFASAGPNLVAGCVNGVLLSSDNGTTWVTVDSGLPANAWVTGFIVLGNNLYLSSQGNGVYVSTNNGVSWTSANSGVRNRFVQSITTDGTNLYAGTWGGLWGTTGGGVFRSSDGGKNWVEANVGLTDTNVTALTTSGTNIFAGTMSGGVFRSTDGGAHWNPVNIGLTYNWGIQALLVNGGNLYVSCVSYGLYVSTNYGSSWSSFGSGLPSKYVNSVAFSASDIFVGSGIGVSRSTDGGNTWSSYNTGLSDTLVSSLTVFGGYLFAGNYAQTVPRLYQGPLLSFGIWRRSP